MEPVLTDDMSPRELSDEDLFLQMAVYNNDVERRFAERAFSELHRRYVAPLHRRCRALCKRLGYPTDMTEDLVSATLVKAYDKADKYDPAKGNSKAKPEQCTLAWLCRIAENMLRDHRRNPNRPSNRLEPYELKLEADQYSGDDFAYLYNKHVHPLPTKQHYQLVDEAFEALDDRTQRVLLETFIQRARSPSGASMQRGSTKMLADHLETTTDNIRRIRRKGLIAINQHLENSMSLNQETGHEEKAK